MGKKESVKKLRTHKDLEVWREAMDLAKEVYNLTVNFPKEEIYGLTLQIRKSAVSIPSNIAEGAVRGTNKEFIQFLYFSLGSLSELETQLLLARELCYLGATNNIFERIEKTRRLLLSLIKFLKNNKDSHHSSPITYYSSLDTGGQYAKLSPCWFNWIRILGKKHSEKSF